MLEKYQNGVFVVYYSQFHDKKNMFPICMVHFFYEHMLEKK